jgi:hypothetical protein
MDGTAERMNARLMMRVVKKAVDTRLIELKTASQYKIFLREWG